MKQRKELKEMAKREPSPEKDENLEQKLKMIK